MKIPFNKPYVTGKEQTYIAEALASRKLAGNGHFSRLSCSLLEHYTDCIKAFAVPSGTAALEMMMILADIGVGDEVIMPSFTFSSTANAVVLRGATPVFIDVRQSDMNIDEELIEKAITHKTKAICPVFYAGVSCNMEKVDSLAKSHNILVLPDAAQALGSRYKGRSLCSYGQMSALSFHETKNIHCGEGGALLINDPRFVERAEIVMEKGTDRSKFFRGEIDKYTWVDLGSSFLINELTAAFLYAQLQDFQNITERRLEIYKRYYTAFEPFQADNKLQLPCIPEDCEHNAHIFWMLLKDQNTRDRFIDYCREKGIGSVFHYIPLHSAPKGLMTSAPAELHVTDECSARLIRLPLFVDMSDEEIDYVINEVLYFLKTEA